MKIPLFLSNAYEEGLYKCSVVVIPGSFYTLQTLCTAQHKRTMSKYSEVDQSSQLARDAQMQIFPACFELRMR